jgi:hypothetical protein
MRENESKKHKNCENKIFFVISESNFIKNCERFQDKDLKEISIDPSSGK